MAILAIYRSKAVSESDFERYRAELPLSKAPEKALIHYYARSQQDGSLCVVDLWEDEAAMRSFDRDAIQPALARAGLPSVEPELFNVETIAVVGAIDAYRVPTEAAVA
jgi:hypothetical protein